MPNNLLLPSGGYRNLKSFQIARLVYDITVRFAELYLDSRSRTCDQMVQAARSGVQNIAEEAMDAATSCRLELNLYNVARGSLEELKLDYQDFLRQHNLPEWEMNHPAAKEFIRRRISSAGQFRDFIQWAENSVSAVSCRSMPLKSVLVANGAILLINAASFFLKRHIDVRTIAFQQSGGFSEKMYRVRTKEKIK